ncbi:MAG TPA: hypothetical protein VN520_08210 [Streptomyces sp.]|uniref:hypothetical protein n=1 Tax=Streptomyces sp. TaxID=1931 RepID=UPI002BF71147|nr:hypothetical protein [Streptomyces sp.]HWU06353.1 hypothetical protein [Streptomyces sp.]
MVPPDSRLRRAGRRYRALSTANRLSLWTGVIAAFAFAVPTTVSAWQALFPDDPATLLVAPNDQSCLTRWYVADTDAELRSGVNGAASPEQLTAWRQEGRIAHAGTLEAAVSVHGNAGASVEIRDISVTVTRREELAPGTVTGPPGCGAGPDEPAYLAVDLDTLPLNRPVPAAYLLRSPQQKAARRMEEDMGTTVSLPHTVASGDFYSFFLIGHTQRYDTDWRATVTWWDGKEMHSRTVSDPGGKELRVVPTGDDPT